MTVFASLHYEHLATVEFTPSILRRILFCAETVERYAVRDGSAWSWDDSGRRITEPDVLAELDAAVREQRRRRRAVEPPG